MMKNSCMELKVSCLLQSSDVHIDLNICFKTMFLRVHNKNHEKYIYVWCTLRKTVLKQVLRSICTPDDCGKHEIWSCIQETFTIEV